MILPTTQSHLWDHHREGEAPAEPRRLWQSIEHSRRLNACRAPHRAPLTPALSPTVEIGALDQSLVGEREEDVRDSSFTMSDTRLGRSLALPKRVARGSVR